MYFFSPSKQITIVPDDIPHLLVNSCTTQTYIYVSLSKNLNNDCNYHYYGEQFETDDSLII